jgi:hypothetical protein
LPKGEPFKPKATALIRVSPQHEGLLSEQPDKFDPVEFANYKATLVALVKSPVILMDALRRDRSAKLESIKQRDEPIEWLERNLQVGFIDNTDIMRISLTTRNPDDSVTLINDIVDALVDRVATDERNTALSRLNEVDRITTEAETNLYSQRQTLKRLAETLRVSDSPAAALQRQLGQQQLADYTRELTRIKLALIAAQAKLAGHAAKKADPLIKGAVDLLQEEISTLTKQEDLLAAEIKRLADQIARSSASSLELQMKQEDLDALNAVVNKLRIQRDLLSFEIKGSQRRVQVWTRAELGPP